MENNWNTIELVEQIIDTNKIKYFLRPKLQARFRKMENFITK